ncbi:TAXI family TRAP transporter solute-binding subunit [Paradesulfitobacterium ferrireducens]|uniref:TAXI family TRAP transporter solute-binding subunit n=1 Tax=Paradesulfitobacterium ferrireducens TaxID=2816476 RepID=UPI001A8C5F80|nr:TAXI family TRAP transporter solute-binding subunit [Paradesulfitobacterium ferrireducens]
MKKVQKKFKFLMAALLAVSLVLAGCQGANTTSNGGNSTETGNSKPKSQTQMALGSGAMGANLYLYASTLSSIVANKPDYGVTVTVQSTGGFEENMNRLARMQLDLAWIAAPEAGMAVKGTGDFTGKAEEYKHLRGIVAIPYGGIQVVTLASKNIKTLSDLKGKTVAIGAAGSSGAKLFLPTLLKEVGVTDKNSKLITMGADQASDAIKNGTIDARTALSMPPLASFTNLAVSKPIRLLGTDAATLTRVMDQLPGTYVTKISKNAYPNQDNEEDILTLGFASLLATRDDINDDAVYNLTKAFWENIEEFGKANPEAKKWNIQDALKGMSIPLAKGAEKFYKEKGVLK